MPVRAQQGSFLAEEHVETGLMGLVPAVPVAPHSLPGSR